MVRHLDPSRVTPVALLASHGPLEDLLTDYLPVYTLPLGDEIVHARRDALGGAGSLRTGLSTLSYIRQLIRFLDQHRIQVIHTNSLKASVLGGIAGRLAGCRVVWHVRDRIADDYLPHKVVLAMRSLARVLPHFVIGNSQATLATLHLPATPTAAIPSGVDLARFHADPGSLSLHAAAETTPLIGLVGRICPWKGQHIFLKAAALVHQHFPNARFQIIGAALFGEHDYDRKLHELVREHHLEAVVDFLGFRKDVPALIQQLTILVHASVVGEPFGQVIVQGMACAKPVVATDGGGVPESVVNGVTGLLVPMGDEHAMAHAIERLLLDPDAARRMGEAGRERVQDRFTVEQTTRRIMDVYDVVADRSPDLS